jgi:ATP sulfurylase
MQWERSDARKGARPLTVIRAVGTAPTHHLRKKEMKDIVERLRLGADTLWPPPIELLREAADEIERLRRRLNEVDAQLTAEDHIHARECMALRAEKNAEIERLYQALEHPKKD